MSKPSLLLLIVLLVFGAAVYLQYTGQLAAKKGRSALTVNAGLEETAAFQNARLLAFSKKLKKYASTNRYNTTVCFMVDMSLPSGKNRFFVYDFTKNQIRHSGLVAHGGGKTGTATPLFSNVVNSGYSSLGKYKVGGKYAGRFGPAYKLHGLDKTNSNAYQRFIVLHAYKCVPDVQVYPLPICNSLGCPMVSINFLKVLQKEISQAKKPILIWVFD